ncbi:MAG: RDD family protein [Verrucomicrobiota bacterium]|nr:RDD family protein [Verrucomicrobiota bacterium]
MPATWYYAESNEQKGPVYAQQVLSLYSNGQIKDNTLVWQNGMLEWTPLSSVLPVIRQAVLAHPTMYCPHCNAMIERADLISVGHSQVCPHCKDAFVQKVKEGASISAFGRVELATPTRRFCAKVIDIVILLVVIYTITYSLASAGVVTGEGVSYIATANILPFFFRFLYNVLQTGNPKMQGTLGKYLLGIKVIRTDGSPITYGRAVGRFFAEYVSMIILFIGYLMIFWDEERRTLHDRIADTLVVHR